jgi:hypothetical protein
MMCDMSDPGPARSHGRARHERPTPRRVLIVAVMLGLSWFVACLAAFVVGFGLTGTTGATRPDLPFWKEPGTGAFLVGVSAAALVFTAGAQISVLRERRRHPNPRYQYIRSTGFPFDTRHYTARQALRKNTRAPLIFVAVGALGLWLRHRYG